MTNLIAICGCSGGEKGPQSIYTHFTKLSTHTEMKYLPYTTIPDNIKKNAIKVVALVKGQFLKTQRPTILIGHSMGGAAAVLAAKLLDEENPLFLKGLVLINPQTEGLYHLQSVKAPMLFIHGSKDSFFPLWQLESSIYRHKGAHQKILLPGLGHDLENKYGKETSMHTVTLASLILNEINRAFCETPITENLQDRTIDISSFSKQTNCLIL